MPFVSPFVLQNTEISGTVSLLSGRDLSPHTKLKTNQQRVLMIVLHEVSAARYELNTGIFKCILPGISINCLS